MNSIITLITQNLPIPLLIIMLVLGITAMLAFIIRLIALRRENVSYHDLQNGITNLLKDGKYTEAEQLCKETPGPVAKIIITAINNREKDSSTITRILEKIGHIEIMQMEKYLSYIWIVQKTTPILGLIGSLISAMAIANSISSSTIIGHTLPAMATTEIRIAILLVLSGLIIATAVYIMFIILSNKIDQIVLDMEEATTDILNTINK